MAVLDTSGPMLHGWNPENEETWDRTIAWRTLAVTTFSLTLAFCTWFLVSAIAPRLNALGFDLDKNQLYWLAALPGLAGGLMRLGYMVLPPILGTRRLVGYTSLLMLIPMFGWVWAVRDPSTPVWVLMAFSFLTGIGGGAFSGYM
ncbi:MAG: MFS transporter, partial [Actinomycetota bacterium]